MIRNVSWQVIWHLILLVIWHVFRQSFYKSCFYLDDSISRDYRPLVCPYMAIHYPALLLMLIVVNKYWVIYCVLLIISFNFMPNFVSKNKKKVGICKQNYLRFCFWEFCPKKVMEGAGRRPSESLMHYILCLIQRACI